MSAVTSQQIRDGERIVKKTVRRYSGLGTSDEDLMAAGREGLMTAIQRFDPDRGVQLSTYAVPCIRTAARGYLIIDSRTVRVPKHRLDQMWRDGTLRPESTTRLDAPMPGTDGRTHHEAVPDDSATDPAEEAERCEMAERMLSGLRERERFIVVQRIWHERTLKDIGDELGVTQERVRQLESRAMRKLREMAGSK